MASTLILAAVTLLLILKLPLNAAEVQVVFNGLQIGVDDQTGSLIHLSQTATGVLLESRADEAGLLELAYPLENSPALRLASRFSRASVSRSSNRVTIAWSPMGASRSTVELSKGGVYAQVQFRPDEDGRSIVFTCHIDNRSNAAVPQVLFPDFAGFRPSEGVLNTELRLAGAAIKPFAEPVRDPDSAPFYPGRGWKEYPSSVYGFQMNALRWLDYGGLRGGLSVFQKKWGTGDSPGVFTYRSEASPMSLRLVWAHRTNIEAGKSWDSGEFSLTPHSGGWAKGIEVYRKWVSQVRPPEPIANHVRDGIGFRTYWEIQTAETDPAKAAFRFKDMPRIARDALDHGIDEIMPWGWATHSTMPIRLRPELGTMQEFLDGVRQAKAMGVNVAPFVSVYTVRNRYAARYGTEPGGSDWTYHPDLIPNLRPGYTKYWDGAHVSTENKVWQEDVYAALLEWIARGVRSFGWDEFWPERKQEGQPDLVKLIARIRADARAQDPESTFAAELVHASDLEVINGILDYTWNWLDYIDAAPLTNVIHNLRLNCNVEDSPRVVKKAFCDNLYLNVMPKKPDQPNGTALIADEPVFATALKEVARLRHQFLAYFRDGIFLGSSMLSEPSSGFVRGYQLGNHLLILVLNSGNGSQYLSAQIDLNVWLPRSQSYVTTYIDHTGKRFPSTEQTVAHWTGFTERLDPLQLAFFEIEAHSSGNR